MLKRIAAAIAALFLLTAPAGAACWQWSLTAGSNSTADPTINWSEGMSPGTVNDSARAMMARLAECRDDLSGKLTTAGTSTAYTLATNQAAGGNAIAATPADGQRLAFRPHATNGAAPTLRVDGGTIFPIQTSPAVAVATGTMLLGAPYSVTFSSSASAWVLHDFYATTINLDSIGSTRGAILERGAGGWGIVAPGTAGTVWTSNGAGADPSYQAIPSPPTLPPQGYLTPTTLTPVIASDSTAATSIFYTPDSGNTVPIYSGTTFVTTVFTELTIALSVAQAANQIYDVCIFLDGATVRGGFTPAWSTATAGSSTRGTGAGTPELTRVAGLLVNAVSMTVNNGASTYSVAANRCTYVGSIFVDGSAGQVTQHRAYGQSRKWGIWNAYNRRPITLRGGDSTASWTYNIATARQSRGDAANTIATFFGLAEEEAAIEFVQHVNTGSSQSSQIGIGVNSTTTKSGFSTQFSGDGNTEVHGLAKHVLTPTLGRNNINMIEHPSGTAATDTYFGTNELMLMTIKFRG